jgi:hypothetical protein
MDRMRITVPEPGPGPAGVADLMAARLAGDAG